jgi:hypothetical protein
MDVMQLTLDMYLARRWKWGTADDLSVGGFFLFNGFRFSYPPWVALMMMT